MHTVHAREWGEGLQPVTQLVWPVWLALTPGRRATHTQLDFDTISSEVFLFSLFFACQENLCYQSTFIHSWYGNLLRLFHFRSLSKYSRTARTTYETGGIDSFSPLPCQRVSLYRLQVDWTQAVKTIDKNSQRSFSCTNQRDWERWRCLHLCRLQWCREQLIWCPTQCTEWVF